jgi:hypothetical protein
MGVTPASLKNWKAVYVAKLEKEDGMSPRAVSLFHDLPELPGIYCRVVVV